MTGPRASSKGRSWTVRLLALGALVMVGGLVAALATRPSATATEVFTPLVGKQAPPIEGLTVRGQPFSLSSYKGRFVVLNFFATWCPPCHTEEPSLLKFSRENSGPGAPALVGVVFADTSANARAFMESFGADWPVVADPSGRIALAYGVRGPPETFIIAPDGLVIAHIDGPVSASYLTSLIARARSLHA